MCININKIQFVLLDMFALEEIALPTPPISSETVLKILASTMKSVFKKQVSRKQCPLPNFYKYSTLHSRHNQQIQINWVFFYHQHLSRVTLKLEVYNGENRFMDFCTVQQQMYDMLQTLNSRQLFINGHYFQSPSSRMPCYGCDLYLKLYNFNLQNYLKTSIKFLAHQIVGQLIDYLEVNGFIGRPDFCYREQEEPVRRQLAVLKQNLEIMRQKKPKHTQINLIKRHEKVIQAIYRVVPTNFSKKKLQVQINEPTKIHTYLKSCQHFQKVNKMMRDYQQQIKKKQQSQRKNEGPIGQPINLIREELDEMFQKRGGTGEIVKLKCTYVLKSTYNNEVQPQEISNKKVKYLLKKYIRPDKVKEQQINKSMQNEFKIIYYLRNEQNQRISNYYSPISHNELNPFQQIDQIYMQEYQQNLEEKCLMPRKPQVGLGQRIKYVLGIIEGIEFLVKKGFIHRDIKEPNIMIDEKGQIKIIDFGSAINHNASKTSFTSDLNKLMSTQSYYVPIWSKTIEQRYKAQQKAELEQHFYRSRHFDVYSIGKIISNLFLRRDQTTSMAQLYEILPEIRYISCKCMEIQPDDRPSIEELKIYFRLIQKLYYVKMWQTKQIKVKSTPVIVV